MTPTKIHPPSHLVHICSFILYLSLTTTLSHGLHLCCFRIPSHLQHSFFCRHRFTSSFTGSYFQFSHLSNSQIHSLHIICPIQSIRIFGMSYLINNSYHTTIILQAIQKKIHLKIYLSSSSAVRIRILPRAVAYLNNIGAEILDEQLPRLSIPNVKQRINNGQGYILLSRIRVSRYKQATKHTISTSAPNKITWVMKNLNIG